MLERYVTAGTLRSGKTTCTEPLAFPRTLRTEHASIRTVTALCWWLAPPPPGMVMGTADGASTLVQQFRVSAAAWTLPTRRASFAWDLAIIHFPRRVNVTDRGVQRQLLPGPDSCRWRSKHDEK
jgi:hypothetical protein